MVVWAGQARVAQVRSGLGRVRCRCSTPTRGCRGTRTRRSWRRSRTSCADNREGDRADGRRDLGAELSDGLSAWKRGVRRPGWERLLERVESGESDGIVVWHTDRLFRQPRDLEAADRRWARRGSRLRPRMVRGIWRTRTTGSFCGSRSPTPPDRRMTRRGGSSAGFRRCARTGQTDRRAPGCSASPGT